MDIRDTLETLGSRVAALSALYDILYDTGGIGDIPLADYLERIIAAAAERLGADARGIVVDRHVAPVSMDMKRAVSLGLVANELVTDCLKHAFPDGRKGRVSVRLTADGASYLLVVEDDGVGLPPGFDAEAAGGFGFKLVELLAGQLGAEFSFGAEMGASFSLRVPA
jgi:two-component sensor histidine kinase